ncbi:hydrolase 1, exosortase A system-associated [Roseateles asaccharophilus]|uniref:Exosortase A-associated hydrolase 1 n=1 Tax=Roseateles asaccharophilus TaxID=582607 RepID=A0ABU2AAC7_9BURK|nr:hydrolase 1, exosortase A system-associated [Roseateles asaccharophilus]MDR7334157.1 exosortase A-associated hydrolase 1 [Roseateles asaccharophilus]
MKESVLGFDCEGERLVGILAEPDGAAAEVGVIIIVGGPQYRAGSHRQFTLLARHLASNGFAALRFDYRSMGDSTGDARDFQGVDADIGAAIAALQAARPGLKRVVLWGLCDAASAALMYLDATHDPRVAGLALANPWARSAATLAQTHVKHYYWRRLRQREFWLKLLRGGVGLKALNTLGSNLKLARSAGKASDSRSFQDRMADGLAGFSGPTLLVLSGDDYTAREFEEHARSSAVWQKLLTRPTLQRHAMPAADHTFSSLSEQDDLNLVCMNWLRTRCLAN